MKQYQAKVGDEIRVVRHTMIVGSARFPIGSVWTVRAVDEKGVKVHGEAMCYIWHGEYAPAFSVKA